MQCNALCLPLLWHIFYSYAFIHQFCVVGLSEEVIDFAAFAGK
jgi:hypothetical protein